MKAKGGYDRRDLVACYDALGVAAHETVYLTGNLGRLGGLVADDGTRITEKPQIVDTHISVLQDLMGPRGTIVSPTHSWSLVRSQTPFDADTTPSDYVFGEILRLHSESVRQCHPFASVAALGARGREIIRPGLHRHAYGVASPFECMGQLNALHISLGLEARQSISAVHHCEVMAQVPYRFTKSFEVYIRQRGHVRAEEVFLNVTYLTEPPLERDRNETICALPGIAPHVRTEPLGRGRVQSLPLGVFIQETTHQMLHNPYLWLRSVTQVRPWA